MRKKKARALSSFHVNKNKNITWMAYRAKNLFFSCISNLEFLKV
jgi:hypothetical protein